MIATGPGYWYRVAGLPEGKPSRRGRCLRCGVAVDAHTRITPAIVEASRPATFAAPVELYTPTGRVQLRAPLSPATIGQYLAHDPLTARPEPYQRPAPRCPECGGPADTGAGHDCEG